MPDVDRPDLSPVDWVQQGAALFPVRPGFQWCELVGPDHFFVTTEPDALSRRELAVARSLDSARLRAENRVDRFLDAAVGLLNQGSGKDFTVQQVVERSGQSLRSFYQYFSGKHDLQLAIFEESVRSTTDHLRHEIAGLDEPIERLRGFVVEYFRLCRPEGDLSIKLSVRPILMAEFVQQLLTTRPKEAAGAFAPLVELFEELLQEAAAAGCS